MSVVEGPTGVGAGGTILAPPRLVKSITTDDPTPVAGEAYIVPVGGTGVFSGHDNEIAIYTSVWTFLDPSESWFAYVDDEDTYYLYNGTTWESLSESAPPLIHALGGVSHSASTLASLNTKISDATLIGTWDEAQIYYVGKGGSDAADGKSVEQRFLTIGAAITAVGAAVPSTSNRFVIQIMDSGIYSENFTMPAFTILHGPGAKVIGGITFDVDSARVVLAELQYTLDVVIVNSSAVDCSLKVDHMLQVSTATTSELMVVDGGQIHLDVGHMESLGAGIQFDNAGKITGYIGHLETALASGIGTSISVLPGSSGTIDLTIDFFEVGATDFGVSVLTATTIKMFLRIGRMVGASANRAFSLSTGDVYIIVGEITGFTTAYNLDNTVNLYMFVGSLSGTETNGSSGTVSITKAGVSPLHAPDHTDGTDDVADLVGDSGSGGTHGLAPAPAAGDGADSKVLRADGSWDDPAYVNIVVRKGSAGTIAVGAPVCITGYNVGQDVPEVEETKADSAATMPAIGLAAETITNSANAVVRVWGKLNGLNTSSFTAGDEVFISEASAGTLVNARPEGATSLIQKVGVVLRSHATLGVIEVYGAGRTNAAPNIADGNIFKGDANGLPQSVSFLHESCHQRAGGDPLLAFDEADMPTGFEDGVSDITLSWDDGTKVLTLTPVAANFNVWVQNKKYTKTGVQTKDISGVIAEGLWFFYYDNTGTLQGSQTPWNLRLHAPVAIMHWDATNVAAILVGWELHDMTMEWSTHKYLHDATGTIFQNGLAVSGDVAGNGANADDAQIAVADGEVHDEDIEITPHDGAGSGLWEQELSPTAQIPVYFRDGAGGLWRKDAATTFPMMQGAARIQYNLDTAGTWTTPDVTGNGRYMAMWIFATNEIAEPIIAVLGQREDTTLSNAQDNNQFEDLSFGTLPFTEMKIIARVIIQTSSFYANVPHARTREILDLRSSFQQPVGNFVATDHGSLSGRNNTNAHPASAIQVDASGFTGPIGTGGTDVQTALASLDSKSKEKFEISFSNGGAVLNTGPSIAGGFYVPFACEIESVVLLADQSGSVVVDLWKDSYANWPPTVADTIVAGAKPTITTATKSKDTTLTGWSPTLAADDIIIPNIDSVTSITELKLILTVRRT